MCLCCLVIHHSWSNSSQIWSPPWQDLNGEWGVEVEARPSPITHCVPRTADGGMVKSMAMIWKLTYGNLSSATHVVYTMCLYCSANDGRFGSRNQNLNPYCNNGGKAAHSSCVLQLLEQYGNNMAKRSWYSIICHPCHFAPELLTDQLLIWLRPNLRPPLRALNGVLRWKQGHPLCSISVGGFVGVWHCDNNTLMALCQLPPMSLCVCVAW